MSGWEAHYAIYNELSSTDLSIGRCYNTVILDVIYDFIKLCKCKTDITVSCTIIDCDFSGFAVMNRCTWEADIWYKPTLLIPLLRCKKEVLATILHNGRIINIQNSAAN